MDRRITWTKINHNEVLIMDQQGLGDRDRIMWYRVLSDLVPNSGKVHVPVILNLKNTKPSPEVIRAAYACMYRVKGFVNKVIVVGSTDEQNAIAQSIGKKGFLEVVVASDLSQAEILAC